MTPCTVCRGSGRVLKDRIVTVHIPPGIHDGQAVRLRDEGEPGEDGSLRGDLHCYVRVEAHPFLERHNNDLVCRMPIAFTQAALGAEVEVPTLSGKAELTVPSSTVFTNFWYSLPKFTVSLLFFPGFHCLYRLDPESACLIMAIFLLGNRR